MVEQLRALVAELTVERSLRFDYLAVGAQVHQVSVCIQEFFNQLYEIVLFNYVTRVEPRRQYKGRQGHAEAKQRTVQKYVV